MHSSTIKKNQNLIQVEIKRRLKAGNACYLSVQNHLSSRLLSKNVKLRRYKTIILPVVLYGWSLTLREEIWAKGFENRVLRRIIGPKRDEVTGEWRKIRNGELRDLYSSPSIRIMKSRRTRWAGHVARMVEKRNVFRLLVGKPEGKSPFERPRRRWVDNIGLDLGEVEWGDVDWIGQTQDRNRWRALVNSVLNLRVP
jgi:hypothetical protein